MAPDGTRRLLLTSFPVASVNWWLSGYPFTVAKGTLEFSPLCRRDEYINPVGCFWSAFWQ